MKVEITYEAYWVVEVEVDDLDAIDFDAVARRSQIIR